MCSIVEKEMKNQLVFSFFIEKNEGPERQQSAMENDARLRRNRDAAAAAAAAAEAAAAAAAAEAEGPPALRFRKR